VERAADWDGEAAGGAATASGLFLAAADFTDSGLDRDSTEHTETLLAFTKVNAAILLPLAAAFLAAFACTAVSLA
jgi:hypothetical protein